jgi:hypothetical protein
VNTSLIYKTFPTALHQQTTDVVMQFFLDLPETDTFLLVNSCARGQAVPESDLDFAVLLNPGTPSFEQNNFEQAWQHFSTVNAGILRFRKSHRWAQIHLDIITGNYLPEIWDDGGGPDYFEVDIGNRIAYSLPLGKEGPYFQKLKNRWLPYYEEELRMQRFIMAKAACEYDIDHIEFYVKRGLYFQAFDRLYKAFQEFLQTLFIVRRTYPIAYNKWIKEQVDTLLKLPELYEQLPSIISVKELTTNDTIEKGKLLQELLNEYCRRGNVTT